MDDLLVDARSGVLTSLEPHIRSDMPTGWVGWAARVADTRNFGGSGSLFRADPYGFGASIRNDAAARGAATGEAVERYCGNVVPEDLVRSSASALNWLTTGRRSGEICVVQRGSVPPSRIPLCSLHL